MEQPDPAGGLRDWSFGEDSPEGAAGMEAPDCACDGSQWPGGTVSGIGMPPGVPADSRSGPGELLKTFQPELLRPAGKS